MNFPLLPFLLQNLVSLDAPTGSKAKASAASVFPEYCLWLLYFNVFSKVSERSNPHVDLIRFVKWLNWCFASLCV